MAGRAKRRPRTTPAHVAVIKRATDVSPERIAERHAWLRNHGYISGTITATDVTAIADRHVLATTTWDTRYELPEGDPASIEIHVSYVLRKEADGLKMVTYISHEDETELLTRHKVPRGGDR